MGPCIARIHSLLLSFNLLFVSLSRLSFLAVVSIDRSIDQLSRKSDGFGNADLALGRFFPDRPFPFPRRKKPFAPSTKVRTSSKSSSSFENHQPRCPMVVETFFDLLLVVVRLKFRDKRPKGKSFCALLRHFKTRQTHL